jgi:hypothetical protein
MLKRMIAGGIALAVIVGASACGPRDETAAVDTMETSVGPADTATLGVPGGTLGTTPDTLTAPDTGYRP